MARSVNKVTLLGNVGKDPEIRSTPGGTMVANLGLATSDRQKDAQGNWQDHTEWHNLKAFNRTAEIVRDYVKKGSKLYIEGKITTNSWEDKETKVEVPHRDSGQRTGSALRAGRGPGSAGAGGYSRPASAPASAASFDQRPPAAAGGADDYTQQTEISDEDIPF